VLTIDNGVTATINTLTITGAGGQHGAAIYVPGGTVNVNGSTITGNTGDSTGHPGGIINATFVAAVSAPAAR